MTEFTWTPPAGMRPNVATAWRSFFRKAASGSAGYTCTPEMYVILYKAQLGVCYICQVRKGINPEDPRGGGTMRLGVDHNHSTGAVRGLLCVKGEWSCNRIVGRYKDDPEAFRRAYQYLTQPPALVLAMVQERAGDLPVEERVRIATELLGVERDALERRVNRAKLTAGLGHSSSLVIVDEAQGFRP